MNRSKSPDPMPAADVLRAAAALADHLQRSGVHWLPQACGDAVESLRSQGRILMEPENLARRQASASPAEKPAARTQGPESRGQADSRIAPPTNTPERSATAGPSPAGPSPAGASPAGIPSRTGRLTPVAAVRGTAEPYPGPSLSGEQRRADLEAMASEVAGCTRCPALVACRKRTVFGEGHESPQVAFFGEGPGMEEDRTGRPFVGKAGQLLTKMIEACTFRRDEVYILNTVKCRPPGNRNPEPQEVANCREYFERQFDILRPQYIVCLGAVSSQALLDSKLSVGRLRGTLHRYFDSKVVVTYHPAYLLRNPAAKKAAWEDLQLMLRDAGIDPRANR